MQVSRFAVSAVLAIAALGITSAGLVHAQDKAKAKSSELPPITKVILENDKVRVLESTFKPGDVSPNRVRNPRVSYVAKGGTLERTYPDGRKTTIDRKTGTAEWNERDTYSVKNIGKTTVVLIGTEVK
ncbi:MAG: hypothetical protein NT123_23765 [Proteobacteria bacterium]|nr:hypothetical protein [Pseudomonadota bacterium]